MTVAKTNASIHQGILLFRQWSSSDISTFLDEVWQTGGERIARTGARYNRVDWMFKVAGCLVAWLPRLSAPSPPDVRALHPGHDPLGILMELSDPLPPAHADTANMGLRSLRENQDSRSCTDWAASSWEWRQSPSVPRIMKNKPTKPRDAIDMVVSDEVQWVEHLKTLLADHSPNDGRGMFWEMILQEQNQFASIKYIQTRSSGGPVRHIL